MFDLDGTLLPMDFDEFFGAYFRHIGLWMSSVIEPEALVNAILMSARAVALNEDFSTNNTEVFYKEFARLTGLSDGVFRPMFHRYYECEFHSLGDGIKPEPVVKKIIAMLKERGTTMVVATNPLFPPNAIEQRIRWAGLDPSDFALITHADNMSSAKPNLHYYRQILSMTGFSANETVMVGNDATEDLAAEKLGIGVFWATPYAICKTEPPSNCPQGDYDALYDFLDRITR